MKQKRFDSTEILLSTKEKKVLRDEFSTTPKTLNLALGGVTNSFLAKKIRQRALEIGGVEREIKDHE